ncbi:glycosyltransferase family 1 protein [Marinobacter fuscus]|uniref:Glycosyltransferase family 1 protein n=1 Tax=Marinobacter fuscus TaxID=2109942 RepID=A0A2T1K445_9GAMM|nr:glycosyltransferase family 4 protein [Marinobacter fuscus]PSF04867.1 glycosyltransferase family 1 protein [Marinobacter fuscus]
MSDASVKKVLHLIDTTGPGGAETVFVNLLTELEQGALKSVVVLRGNGWVADQVRRLGIEPYIIDSKGSFNFKYIKRLRELIVSQKIDLIHAHLLGSNVYGAILSLITRTPMISTFHGAVDVASKERFLRAKFAIIGWGSSVIVCVSDRLKAELARRSPLPARKLQLIYNGVDPGRFLISVPPTLRNELGIPPNAIVVVSIGNIRPAKGYEYLVASALELAVSDPEFHFIVVGHQRKELFSKLQHQMASASRPPNIHWLGYREDVVGLLKQADIFLLPSVSEGFSISTVEAMMAGVPVVATRSGGPEEIISDSTLGCLIPPANSKAITEALLKLKDRAVRKAVTEQARTAANSRFGLAGMLASYSQLYQRLIKS